ncbi:hypothetical protein GOODEAATRI_032946 [Goodea atripinnis]|uniref:Secreted protein n=1 Tax=Goodea atripinnis TaxID=208336 RepID=A0ABV0PTU7_9TELE
MQTWSWSLTFTGFFLRRITASAQKHILLQMNETAGVFTFTHKVFNKGTRELPVNRCSILHVFFIPQSPGSNSCTYSDVYVLLFLQLSEDHLLYFTIKVRTVLL